MNDLISRQDAANLLYKMLADDYVDGYAYLEQLRSLPSTEPERIKGKWVDAILYHEPDDFEWEKVKCSSCKNFVTKPIFYHNNKYNFCPNCGADMRGE